MRVYAAEGGATLTEFEGVQTEWEDVGEINDIILTREGAVEAVLVDLGGFLGIGERQVAMNMGAIKFVADASTEATDDYFLVIPATRANLEEAPEYDLTGTEMAQSTEAMEEKPMADQTEDVASGNATMTAQPREGYEMAKIDDLTAEDLTGARVYDTSEEWIGEISELLLTDSGKIDRAVVDVGGFLGLGEKPVALSMDEIKILRGDDAGDLRIEVAKTQDELEAMPTYEN